MVEFSCPRDMTILNIAAVLFAAVKQGLETGRKAGNHTCIFSFHQLNGRK
jgi:hypothetical protein